MRDMLKGSTKIRNIMTESLDSKCYRLFLGVVLTCRQWLMYPFTHE